MPKHPQVPQRIAEPSQNGSEKQSRRLPLFLVAAVFIGAVSAVLAYLFQFESSGDARVPPNARVTAATRSTSTAHFCGSREAPLSLVADSLLDDGILDCCDGSDEADSLAPVGCASNAEKALRALRDVAHAHDAGVLSANATITALLGITDAAAARREVEAATRKSVAAAAAVDRLRSRIAKMQAQMQKKPTEGAGQLKMATAFNELQKAHREMVQAAGAAVSARRLAELAESGGAVATALLSTGPCAQSLPVSEKSSKGGSTTSVPKQYAMRACFAGAASQIEFLPDEWNRADAATKGEDAAPIPAPEPEAKGKGKGKGKGKASKMAAAGLPNRTWTDAPTGLGSWIGFVPLEHAAQQFAAGVGSYPGVGVPARDLMDAYHMVRLNSGPGPGGELDRAKMRRAGLSDAAVDAALALTRHVSGRWAGDSATSTSTSSSPDPAAAPASLHGVAAVYMDESGPLCRSEDVEAPRRLHVLHTCPGVPRPNPELRAALLAAEAAAGSAARAGAGASRAVTERAARAALLRRALLVGGPGELALERFSPQQWNSAGALADGEAAAEKAVAAAKTDKAKRKALAGKLWPAVVHAEEDGLCAYRLWVATPLACSAEVAAAARAEADALAAAYGL